MTGLALSWWLPLTAAPAAPAEVAPTGLAGDPGQLALRVVLPGAAAHVAGTGGTTNRDSACQRGPGTVTTTVQRTGRRTLVGFTLAGALPLQRYGFGVEFSWKKPGNVMQPGSYDGVTSTSLFGTADFHGFSAPARARVSYDLLAEGDAGKCRTRGAVRAR